MYLGKNSEDVILQCAACSHDCTHQEEVVVFNRNESTEQQFMRVQVNWSEVTIDDCMAGNPSPRRQAVVIAYTCEECNAVSQLIVMQHKGTTFVRVRHAGFRIGLNAYVPIELDSPTE